MQGSPEPYAGSEGPGLHHSPNGTQGGGELRRAALPTFEHQMPKGGATNGSGTQKRKDIHLLAPRSMKSAPHPALTGWGGRRGRGADSGGVSHLPPEQGLARPVKRGASHRNREGLSPRGQPLPCPDAPRYASSQGTSAPSVLSDGEAALFFICSSCHCSLVMRTCRGLLPSKGPTTPRSSIWSTRRAARE